MVRSGALTSWIPKDHLQHWDSGAIDECLQWSSQRWHPHGAGKRSWRRRREGMLQRRLDGRREVQTLSRRAECIPPCSLPASVPLMPAVHLVQLTGLAPVVGKGAICDADLLRADWALHVVWVVVLHMGPEVFQPSLHW